MAALERRRVREHVGLNVIPLLHLTFEDEVNGFHLVSRVIRMAQSTDESVVRVCIRRQLVYIPGSLENVEPKIRPTSRLARQQGCVVNDDVEPCVFALFRVGQQAQCLLPVARFGEGGDGGRQKHSVHVHPCLPHLLHDRQQRHRTSVVVVLNNIIIPPPLPPAHLSLLLLLTGGDDAGIKVLVSGHTVLSPLVVDLQCLVATLRFHQSVDGSSESEAVVSHVLGFHHS
mmetsp:Transcript_18225/g.36766  ORF Transcript_18225/g.36766 Transcript_18225/m.36766 type:complete len:229 (-) Transcript_18225:676-1362(-)